MNPSIVCQMIRITSDVQTPKILNFGFKLLSNFSDDCHNISLLLADILALSFPLSFSRSFIRSFREFTCPSFVHSFFFPSVLHPSTVPCINRFLRLLVRPSFRSFFRPFFLPTVHSAVLLPRRSVSGTLKRPSGSRLELVSSTLAIVRCLRWNRKVLERDRETDIDGNRDKDTEKEAARQKEAIVKQCHSLDCHWQINSDISLQIHKNKPTAKKRLTNASIHIYMYVLYIYIQVAYICAYILIIIYILNCDCVGHIFDEIALTYHCLLRPIPCLHCCDRYRCITRSLAGCIQFAICRIGQC